MALVVEDHQLRAGHRRVDLLSLTERHPDVVAPVDDQEVGPDPVGATERAELGQELAVRSRRVAVLTGA
jgi:hypothetical protein